MLCAAGESIKQLPALYQMNYRIFFRVGEFQEHFDRVKEIEKQRKKSMEKGKGMER